MRDEVMKENKKHIIDKAKANSHVFRPIYLNWLEQNMGVFMSFEHAAIRIHRNGREHYSARRIFEELRNDTMIGDQPVRFRINGDFVPDSARLFMLLHPECGEFFELRGRTMAPVDDNQVDMFGVMA